MAKGRFNDEREVEDVAARVAAGVRIRRMLMHGDVAELGVSGADVLGAIAVMGIQIPNGNARDAARESVEGRDGDRVQIAESHRLAACRVVTRRPHQRESPLASQRESRAFDRRAGRSCSVLENAIVIRRVGIEMVPLIQVSEVPLRVRLEHGIAPRWRRRSPLPFGVRAPQVLSRPTHALRSFGVSGRAVAGTALVMENGHFVSIALDEQDATRRS